VISVPRSARDNYFDEAQENIAEDLQLRCKRGPIEATSKPRASQKNPKREIALADASHGERKERDHLIAAVATRPAKMNQGKTRLSRAKPATWSKAAERSVVRALVGMDGFGPRHLNVLARKSARFFFGYEPACKLSESALNLPQSPPRCYLRLMPKISHFECSRCKKAVSADKPQTLCPDCAGSLYVRYDLSAARGTARRDAIVKDAASSPWPGMWRYRAVLPEVTPVTLGEGWTPMLRSKRYANVI